MMVPCKSPILGAMNVKTNGRHGDESCYFCPLQAQIAETHALSCPVAIFEKSVTKLEFEAKDGSTRRPIAEKRTRVTYLGKKGKLWTKKVKYVGQ